jgi:4-diphosphocytidyl-2-C-methyl-D-erythritol kinase
VVEQPMTASLRLPAPAKLNLMLHITGRRADGYHLLQTVFQFIDLSDWLEFELAQDGRIQRLQSTTPIAAENDIVLAAAKLLQARFGVSGGVSIRVEKHIPIGGGLGGGSSDAASCLLALNRLWKLDLTLSQLAEIGLELGADVPVFVQGRAAWAGGVGEVLQAIDIEEPIYLVIDPQIKVSTAQIFAAQELTRNCDPITIRAFLRGVGTNVCEPVVRKHHPQVGDALDWLNQFGQAHMSGTGGCVFVEFDSLQQAEIVKSQVPEPWVGYVATAMNNSPVHQQPGLLD